jgi:signal transduction histidine kinase
VIGRAVGIVLGLTIAVDVAFLLGLVASNGDQNPIVNVGLSLASQWIAVSVFWLVAARTGFRTPAVLLAAAAVTFSAIGDTYWSLAMDGDGYLPFPSPADVGYLLFYPLMVAALVMLVRRQLGGAGRLVLLEIAVAAVGASAVLAVALDPVITAALAGDDVVESTVAVAYPLFDVILIAVIAGIAAVPAVSIGRHRWALIAGLVIFTAADVAYALLENDGAYVAGTPLDATWAVGLLLITWWVSGMATSPASPAPTARPAAVVRLPAIAVLAGLAILVVGTQVQLSMAAVLLAGLTVALGAVPIIFRQAMLGRMLAAQEEAVRRLTELDQAKTDMLTTVNHEFRTPLTSINGHVELLLDGGGGDLPASAVRMLETVERNGARLQSLIDATFAAARFANEPTPAARTVVGVADLVAGSVERVAPHAAQRRVHVEVAIDPTLRVDGDETDLTRALSNLLDNAVKFSPSPGRVEVTGSALGDEVVIRIVDAGIGIPADDIPRLFEKFFRAANVQSAAIPGVGLGLSIARQIVEAHAGTIEVESVVGTRTTLTVRLPAALSPATAR